IVEHIFFNKEAKASGVGTTENEQERNLLSMKL
ncbi:MAG: hypothetical protein H6R42_1048, partial [Nitrospirae bacterium]|nr:hypothetical protein [Nitrospirota bacterium]